MEQQNLVMFVSILILSLLPICPVSSNLAAEEFFDRCLDGKLHKRKPGPEDNLHKQCSPWANRSCCTPETAKDAHYKDMYNFNWNHCQEKQDMSADCRRHFVQDMCFYECSPNVGPWLVGIQQNIRNEKFFNVPLCASDCDRWFDACKNDLTCTNNWGRNFDWVPGSDGKKTNKCPKSSTCITFKKVFHTAKEFCEQVWDHSWQYTPDNQPCMRLWFDGTQGNPNDDVLRWKVQELVSSSQRTQGQSWISILLIASIIFLQ